MALLTVTAGLFAPTPAVHRARVAASGRNPLPRSLGAYLSRRSGTWCGLVRCQTGGSDKEHASEWTTTTSNPLVDPDEELVRSLGESVPLTSGKEIMVAIDGGEHSRKALDFALSNLTHKGDVLHLVNVVPLDSTYAPISLSPGAMVDILPAIDPDLRAAAERQSKALLDSVAESVAAAGHRAVCHSVIEHTWESVSHAICAKAEDLDVQMVVIASSGKNWVRAPA